MRARAVSQLVAVILAISLVACSSPAPDGGAAQERTKARTGRRLYAEFGCGRCHGERLEGTRTAPPLTGLGAYWSIDGIVEYMRSPALAEERVPRLRYLSEQYAIDMSAVRADDERLRHLAAYLLAN